MLSLVSYTESLFIFAENLAANANIRLLTSFIEITNFDGETG